MWNERDARIFYSGNAGCSGHHLHRPAGGLFRLLREELQQLAEVQGRLRTITERMYVDWLLGKQSHGKAVWNFSTIVCRKLPRRPRSSLADLAAEMRLRSLKARTKR